MKPKIQSHRSTLKQTNKLHNTLGHKTKGQQRSIVQGRASSLFNASNKPRIELNGIQRRHQVKQFRDAKKEKNRNLKHSLGTDSRPPFLVSVIMMSPDINPRLVTSALTEADPRATVTVSNQGNIHISSAMFKQRFTFVLPPIDNMEAILNAVQVSTTVLVVWPSCERGDTVLGGDQEMLISAIKALGLPTPVHAVVGFQDMAQKSGNKRSLDCCTDVLSSTFSQTLSLQRNNTKKSSGYQNLMSEVNHHFSGHGKAKIYQLDKPGESILCLRQLGAQKHRSLFFRDHRPHMIAEKVEFEDNEDDTSSKGTLRISGYIRGVPLSANSLVTVTGWDDYQMSHITMEGTDPYPLTLPNKKVHSTTDDIVLYPDPEQQHDLEKTVVDFSDDGADTAEEEKKGEDVSAAEDNNSIMKVPTKKSKVPKSVNSAYVASWFDYGDDNNGSSDEDSGSEDEFEAPAPIDDDASTVFGGGGDDDDDYDDDRMSMVSVSEKGTNNDSDNYDANMDYDGEDDELQRIRKCRADFEYPDEVDTPRDMNARDVFKEYRGMESFKSSPWDMTDNLPKDYRKIYSLDKFNHYRKQVFKLANITEGAEPGRYVTVHIVGVEKHKYRESIQSGSPLVVSGLMPHENRMSLANYVLNSNSNGHTRVIKSKDSLIFYVGFRRFVNKPIFSEHTNGDKQKFCRYFRPNTTVVASMYAPITFPPACVLVFRKTPSGKHDLVATGSVYSSDVNRCVVKKVVLSAHPFKIHKRVVVARYMFFNRDDINWYSLVELRTKQGKKGKIKKALGTHGHMKCQFNGILQSHDTIFLTLYKRVFPKWTYDMDVPKSIPLYYKGAFDSREEDDDEIEESVGENEEITDTMLMPPPLKKLRFFS